MLFRWYVDRRETYEKRKDLYCIDVVTYRMIQKIEKIEQSKEPLKSHFKVIKHYYTVIIDILEEENK